MRREKSINVNFETDGDKLLSIIAETDNDQIYFKGKISESEYLEKTHISTYRIDR